MVRPIQYKDIEFKGHRGKIAAIVENKKFIRFITFLILINAITLGLEVDQELNALYGKYFQIIDALVIFVFILELAMKLYLYKWAFFKVGWNVFDLVIVCISMAPHSGGMAILRSLRIIRIFRLFSLVPQMRDVVNALLFAIPGMAAITGVLTIIVYIAAVLSTHLFGQHPDPQMQYFFGSVGKSMYTMFQLMTLDDWTDVAAYTMQYYSWAWAFFIPFIILTTFAVLNLFIGIIVDALNILKEESKREEKKNLIDEIKLMNTKIDELQTTINNLQKNKR